MAADEIRCWRILVVGISIDRSGSTGFSDIDAAAPAKFCVTLRRIEGSQLIVKDLDNARGYAADDGVGRRISGVDRIDLVPRDDYRDQFDLWAYQHIVFQCYATQL